MTIRFRCKCGRQFEVADSAAGRKARCTDCGLTFLVPSPHAKPAAPAPDNSPLAQAARAAQAAAAAHSPPAERQPKAPPPAARQAAPARPASPPPPPRPAAPPAAHRPAQPPSVPPVPRQAAPRLATPPPPRPAAPQATHALRQDDDVPIARLAPVPVHHGPRTIKLTAVQAVAGISILVAIAVIADSLMTMFGAIQAQVQGWDLIYGAVAIVAGIGIIVAMAAGAGSRVCIGILMGGAIRGVFNGLILIGLAFTKHELVTVQGADAVTVVGIAGVAAFLLSILYIIIPLLSRPIRKHLHGHAGAVIGGVMVGLLLGPLAISTALPDPSMLYARKITLQRVQKHTAVGADGASVVLTPKQQTEMREAMTEQMKDIHRAMSRFVIEEDRRRLPAHLGELVGGDCPSKLFLSPTRGPKAKAHKDPAGDIKNSDVIYLFKKGRETAQFEAAPNRAELIVAYSGPDCGLGDGALVMRLPGIQVPPVEWLDKAALEKQLAATEKWLKDNPATENIMPVHLPGAPGGKSP